MAEPTVTMIAPDGSIADVPQSSIDQATRSGAKYAMNMRAPDGSTAWVPQDQLGSAMKAGAVLIGQSKDQSQPTQFEQQRSGGQGFSKTIASDVKNTAINLLPSLGKLMTPAGGVEQATNIINNSLARQREGRGSAYEAAARTADVLGIPTRPMEEAANRGDTGAVWAHAAVPSALVVGGSVLGAKATDAISKALPGALPKEVAVRQLVDAFNPDVKDMPRFTADLSQHLDTILQTAQAKKIPLNKGASGFAEAAKAAGDDAHSFYMDKMVKPIQNESVPVPASSPIGRRVGEYAGNKEASVGEVVGRLQTINDTLYPKFQKGGLSAQAAIGAENAQALTAEASQLRNTLNNYMAKRLDMPVEQVAQIRSKMGALRQLADDTQFYADEARHNVNQIANQPVKGDTRASAFAIQKAQIAYRRRFGTPADKIVSNVTSRYQPGPVASHEPTLLDQTQAPNPRFF